MERGASHRDRNVDALVQDGSVGCKVFASQPRQVRGEYHRIRFVGVDSRFDWFVGLDSRLECLADTRQCHCSHFGWATWS